MTVGHRLHVLLVGLGHQFGVLSGIIWNNLAEISERRRDFSPEGLARTESCYLRCEQIYSRIFGPSHPQLGAIYNGWGLALEAAGETARASDMYEKSLANRRAMLGDTHQDLVPTLSNLMASHMCSDRMEEALACEEWIGRILLLKASEGSGSVVGDASIASHFRAQSRVARRDVIHLIMGNMQ